MENYNPSELIKGMENMKMKNRELKFRAYDTLTKKMSPDFVLFGEFTLLGAVHAWQHEEAILAGLKWDSSDNHDSLGRLNDLEIMRYTGLKDKNGKEIYEGDIIQNVSDNGIRLSIFEILYDLERGGFCKDRIDTNDRYMLEPSRFYEVIGNIFEHPHLVEKAKTDQV